MTEGVTHPHTPHLNRFMNSIAHNLFVLIINTRHSITPSFFYKHFGYNHTADFIDLRGTAPHLHLFSTNYLYSSQVAASVGAAVVLCFVYSVARNHPQPLLPVREDCIRSSNNSKASLRKNKLAYMSAASV